MFATVNETAWPSSTTTACDLKWPSSRYVQQPMKQHDLVLQLLQCDVLSLRHDFSGAQPKTPTGKGSHSFAYDIFRSWCSLNFISGSTLTLSVKPICLHCVQCDVLFGRCICCVLTSLISCMMSLAVCVIIIIIIIIYEFLVRLLQSGHRCITWVWYNIKNRIAKNHWTLKALVKK